MKKTKEKYVQVVEEQLEVEDGLGKDVHAVADVLDELLVVEGGIVLVILYVINCANWFYPSCA